MSARHSAPIASVPPAQPPANATQNQRAADFLTPGPGRSAGKDADGDYKPDPVQTSSSAVQAAVTDLKLGG